MQKKTQTFQSMIIVDDDKKLNGDFFHSALFVSYSL